MAIAEAAERFGVGYWCENMFDFDTFIEVAKLMFFERL